MIDPVLQLADDGITDYCAQVCGGGECSRGPTCAYGIDPVTHQPVTCRDDDDEKFIAHLNALPKYPDAGTPFGEIKFMPGHGGWWAECPKSGFGYWYRTLEEAVCRWVVFVVARDGDGWRADRLPCNVVAEALGLSDSVGG